MMRLVGPIAQQVKAERSHVLADNPLLAGQEQLSRAMVRALNFARDVRDEHVERSFHAIYGLPLVQAACGISQNDGPPRPRPGLSPSVLMAAERERVRLKGRIAEGSALDAAARVLVYVGKAQHRIEKSTFDALRKLLLAYPEVTETEFKAAVREQWAILAVDERAAIEALPRLLPPGAEVRREFSALVQRTLPAVGKLNVEGQRRLRKVLEVLGEEGGSGREIAAE
jgi:hypothetical protein